MITITARCLRTDTVTRATFDAMAEAVAHARSLPIALYVTGEDSTGRTVLASDPGAPVTYRRAAGARRSAV